jgi:serine/threonine-protein kinase RsbW
MTLYRTQENKGRMTRHWLTSNAVVPSSCEGVVVFMERLLRMLTKHHFEEGEATAIRHAVEEALWNAISHGNQYDPSKEVHVTFTIGPTEFNICIEDEGGGFDPLAVPDPTAPGRLQEARGRGLLLMRHFMDAVRYNAKANSVTLVRKRVPAGRASRV